MTDLIQVSISDSWVYAMVDRKRYENDSVCISKGGFFKPDLRRVEAGGRPLMLKDIRAKTFLSRWTLGLWLIDKEWKIYSRLKGIPGIPEAVERVDRFAFAMEFVSGKPIERRMGLPSSFFLALSRILKEVHARGIVHLDLRHKGNILVSEAGEPFLIDFNSGFFFKGGGFLRRVLFPFLRWVDDVGFLKLKQRVSPSQMTREEITSLKWFNRLRRLWIFN